MNSAYLLGLVSDKVHTAHAIFEPGGKAYTYLTVLPDLKPGDEVIVEVGERLIGSIQPTKPGLKVATVVRVDETVEVDPHSPIAYKWIVSNAGTTARVEQAKLHEMENGVLTMLREAELNTRRKKLAKELEDTFGTTTLKKVKALTDFSDKPAKG